ncbi:hypothetical protein [Acinetobacter terrae]|uniref:hypothetical protein n=1 Tax=Acinetobacter terrae TaxID=2731247 RepID=UPI001BE47431|nr:hypothetical protein [Acinetobacter terrae]
MNQKSLFIGVGVTIVWFLGITIFCIWGNFGFEKNDLNSLGDFLAGIFAPVAFFWLILGYVQQGKQLDQNTKALEQQERALQLQIDEMKESVKQQTELVNIQRQQFEDQQRLFEPRFIISNTEVFNVLGQDVDRDSENNHLLNLNQNVFIKVTFNLINFGEEIFDLKIKESGKQLILVKFDHITVGRIQSIELELTDIQIDLLNREQQLLAEFDMDFMCKNGRKLCQKLRSLIYKRNDLQFGAEFFLYK